MNDQGSPRPGSSDRVLRGPQFVLRGHKLESILTTVIDYRLRAGYYAGRLQHMGDEKLSVWKEKVSVGISTFLRPRRQEH